MSDQIGLKLTKELSDNRKGDFAEFYAVTWLWDQGFDVFKNCGCDGPIDMIAWNKENHDFVLVDVKTMSYDPVGSETKSFFQKSLLLKPNTSISKL